MNGKTGIRTLSQQKNIPRQYNYKHFLTSGRILDCTTTIERMVTYYQNTGLKLPDEESFDFIVLKKDFEETPEFISQYNKENWERKIGKKKFEKLQKIKQLVKENPLEFGFLLYWLDKKCTNTNSINYAYNWMKKIQRRLTCL